MSYDTITIQAFERNRHKTTPDVVVKAVDGDELLDCEIIKSYPNYTRRNAVKRASKAVSKFIDEIGGL